MGTKCPGVASLKPQNRSLDEYCQVFYIKKSRQEFKMGRK